MPFKLFEFLEELNWTQINPIGENWIKRSLLFDWEI